MVGGEARPTDGVLSTMPLRYVPALAPMLPEDYIARIQALHNIPVACVILKLAQPLTGNFWLNINDPAIEIPGLIEYSNLNPGTGAHIVYAPFYMPRTHPKWSHGNAQLIDEVVGYLGRINPGFRSDWVLASRCHRYEYAQPICPPGFYDMLPAMRTPLEGLFIADTSYYYPEDRSINESFATGAALAREALGARSERRA
jgi:protoporphyrinogen oxidase